MTSTSRTITADHAEALAELNALRFTVAKMEVSNQTLAAENRRLRRLTTNGKQGRILHRAAADARTLAAWRFSGFSIARRAAVACGMAERRWNWGIALLRLAGVVNMDGAIPADEFLIEDAADVDAAIGRATAKVEKHGLSLLIFRMAKGRARG